MHKDEQTGNWVTDDLTNDEIRAGIKTGLYCYMCGGDIDGRSFGRKRMCSDCIYDRRDSNGILQTQETRLQKNEKERG
jgi:hypothetical protein